MVLHRGGKLTTIDQVRAVPLPELEEGSKYAIVPHGAVIDMIERRFETEVGVAPVWTVATNRGGSQFFGIAAKPRSLQPSELGVLAGDEEDTPAVAVRNSLDKSTRYGLALGLKLFICDNLSISGSSLSWSRIHIGEAWKEIQTQTVGHMAQILGVYEREKETMAHLKAHHMDREDGFRLLGVAMGRNILLPRLAQVVIKAWRRQESEFGSGWTAYRLLQHMTQALQREPARQQMPKLAAAHDLVIHEA
jgi:hypothetical protein